MTENDKIRGRDISKPIDHIELAGQAYPLAFDMEAMRVAEDVYELQYNRSLNFADIVRQLVAGKLGAVMAVLYGALLSGAKHEGGKSVTWDEFSNGFRLTSIPGIQELLAARVRDALPEPDGSGENPPKPGEA